MRSVRMLLGIIGLIALLGGIGACGRARAANAAGVWVEVSPSSITAGFQITVRADCGDNSNPATVTSKAFGTITVAPGNTLLLAQVVVPATTREGTYDVTVTCRTGATATATLSVLNKAAALPTMGPHTGGGFLANGDDGGLSGPAVWLLGGVGALAAAAALGAVSVRRRRRVPVR